MERKECLVPPYYDLKVCTFHRSFVLAGEKQSLIGSAVHGGMQFCFLGHSGLAFFSSSHAVPHAW